MHRDAGYHLYCGDSDLRRIFTDGRALADRRGADLSGLFDRPWIDEDGDGVYDVLEVETRGPFKGPRAYDASGLPLHFDNQSIFKERFHLDKNDPNLLHDEITVIDHALTRPWTWTRPFGATRPRTRSGAGISCTEGTNNVAIGTDNYLMSGDGILMPTKKDQPPPDPRYFKQTQK